MSDTEGKEVLTQEKLSLQDKLLDKLLSRKLAVWLFSNYLLVQQTIDIETWMVITTMFLGAEVTQNIAGLIKAKVK